MHIRYEAFKGRSGQTLPREGVQRRDATAAAASKIQTEGTVSGPIGRSLWRRARAAAMRAWQGRQREVAVPVEIQSTLGFV